MCFTWSQDWLDEDACAQQLVISLYSMCCLHALRHYMGFVLLTIADTSTSASGCGTSYATFKNYRDL